jgi:hypothetical protein
MSSLGNYEAPLFMGTMILLHGSTYNWNMCVVLYEKAITNVTE